VNIYTAQQISHFTNEKQRITRMKSFLFLFLLPLTFYVGGALLTHQQSFAQSFRVGGGFGSAFEQVVAVRFPLPGGGSYLYPVASPQNATYHAAVRYMLSTGAGSGFTLSGNVHRAETPVFTLLDPTQQPLSVKISQTLLPLGIGFEYRFFWLLLVHAYMAGEATGNVFFYTTESSILGTETLITKRLGANLALGADLTIFGIGADVAVRYSWANIVGREQSELTRTFLTLTVSIVLGEK
jgi:hypothetical protein